MALLELDQVHAGYSGSAEVLSGVTLSLDEGEQVAILGRNGAGKSTFLRVVAGLLKPFHGHVRYAGKSNPAILLQNPRQQLVCATVREEIEFTLRMNGAPEADLRKITESLLDRFSLQPLQDRAPIRLSGGQQQMLALAALLSRDPELLLLDEPDAFLDGASRREFRSFFAAHIRAATIWIVCRKSEIPERMRTFALESGKLVQFAEAG